MPKYSEEVIQQVMEANDLVDIVSQYTKLKRSGRSYMGCCPFHNERTPSFSVSRDKQLYHCFGCGVGGNVYTFVMEKENMSFPEAITYLAERANITLPKGSWQDDANDRKREAMLEMNRLLANHYYTLLKHAPAAQTYAAGRGLTAEIMHEFGIGYAADAWQEALAYLTKKGCDVAQMLEAGIEIRSDSGRIYDRFRDRLMIPIQNSGGKIIGFGGRAMQDKPGEPKYLNSPESFIFTKGRELFNLNRAKKHIEGGRLILVEGYMDVIALYQAGIQNVIAALGTAFTPEHAKKLNRYVSEIVLCFDGDAAGEKATQRAIDILGNALKVYVVRLDAKDDPDSYVRAHGADAFRALVADAVGAVDYQLDGLKRDNPLSTNDERLKYVEQAIPIVARVKTDIERDVYAKRVAEETGVSAKMIYQEAKQRATTLAEAPAAPVIRRRLTAQTQPVSRAVAEAERIVIAALIGGQLDLPTVAAKLAPEAFAPGWARKVYTVMLDNRDQPLREDMLVAALENPEDQQRLAALIMRSDRDNGADEAFEAKLQESLAVLAQNQKDETARRLQQKMTGLSADDPQTTAFLQDIIELRKNQSKGF